MLHGLPALPYHQSMGGSAATSIGYVTVEFCPCNPAILLLIHESLKECLLVLVEVVIVCHVLQEIDGSVVANSGYQDSGLHPLHTNHHSLHIQKC